jgi:hypothetical protein
VKDSKKDSPHRGVILAELNDSSKGVGLETCPAD